MWEKIISKEHLNKILNIVDYVKSQGNYLELYIYRSKYKNLDIKKDVCNDINYMEKSGLGVLLEKSGIETYFYYDDLDFLKLEKKLCQEFCIETKKFKNKNIEPLEYGYHINFFDTKKFINQVNKFKEKIINKKYDYKLTLDYEEILIINNDTCVCDGRIFHKLFKIKNNKIIDTFSSSNLSFAGNNILNKKQQKKNYISIKDYNIEKIILFPKASGLLFHEIAHALENDYFNKKNPLFNKINNKVSTELLTMSNDPYMIYGKNIRHVDDEGKFLTKNILIEKGLLKKIIGCRYAKEKKQIKNSSQSSRRESHRFISTGRSYCIVVNPVKRNKLKSILNFNDVLVIHDFKKGCFNFEDGKIYCTSNDFSVVKNGIFNGIKGTIKIENKVDVILSSIIDIFDDLEYFENMCYSSSGHISNSTYTPSILLKNSNLNCKLTIF